MKEAGILLLLGICSIEDLYKKKIHTCWLVLCGVIGILSNLFFWKQSWRVLLMGMIPGSVLLLLSKITGNKIGTGDGFLLLATGMILGIAATVRLLCYAVFLVSSYALFLLVVMHKGKNYEIAFVPFLLAADIVRLALPL